MNVIKIETISKNTQTAAYCGRYETYKVTYQEELSYTVILLGNTFNYDGKEIKNIPESVIEFAENWILGEL